MNAFERYRQVMLGMVSDTEILTLAGDGDMRNLWQICKRGPRVLRTKLSQALGSIEREKLGGAAAPEWTTPVHNLLVEVFACTVERYPCPR